MDCTQETCLSTTRRSKNSNNIPRLECTGKGTKEKLGWLGGGGVGGGGS